MKGYLKPWLLDEDIEIEDIIAASNEGETEEGESGSLKDIMGGIFS